jgi:hypothetical protein
MILGCSVVILYVLRWKTCKMIPLFCMFNCFIAKPKSSVTLSKSSSFAEQQLKVQPFIEKQHVKKHRYSRPKHTVVKSVSGRGSKKHSLVDSITDFEFEDPGSIPLGAKSFLHRPKLMKIFA